MIRNISKVLSITILMAILSGCGFQINLSDNKPVVFYASDLSGSWYRYEDGKTGKNSEGVEEIILRKVGNLTYRMEGHKRHTIALKPEKQELVNANNRYYNYEDNNTAESIIPPVYDITFTWENTEISGNNDMIKTVRGDLVYDSELGKVYTIKSEDGTDVLVSGDEKWYRSKDKVFKVIEERKTERLRQTVADNNKKYPMANIEIGKVKYIGK